MKNRKRILIILIIIEVILVSALICSILTVGRIGPSINEISEKEVTESTMDESNEPAETEEEEQEEAAVEYVLKESAWLPPWYFDESFNSLKEHRDILDTVNPVFYSVNSNGTLLDRKPGESVVREFLKYCDDNGIPVIPTIGSYSFNVTNTIFASESAYTKHVENIVAEVEKYNFDGIDIDYEKINREWKENYINFLSLLGQELESRDKLLSVTVFAQWGDSVDYENHEDTIYAQNLSQISEIADQVRVMTYDYTLQSSSTPGPIGPIGWIEEVIEYTLTKVAKEKFWLGVHLYGYRWKDGEATALTPASYKAITTNSNINTQFKEDIAEGYAEYSCDSSSCYLYYQTKEGVELRRGLATEYGLAGVSYWSIGRDDGLLSK